ncbi:hypothetical protein Mapa_001426 [Marchantia paleacea]|nr:hypothetical protein Mapa_001426 [Marchantia paleacea]
MRSFLLLYTIGRSRCKSPNLITCGLPVCTLITLARVKLLSELEGTMSGRAVVNYGFELLILTLSVFIPKSLVAQLCCLRQQQTQQTTSAGRIHS